MEAGKVGPGEVVKLISTLVAARRFCKRRSKKAELNTMLSFGSVKSPDKFALSSPGVLEGFMKTMPSAGILPLKTKWPSRVKPDIPKRPTLRVADVALNLESAIGFPFTPRTTTRNPR